jgi:hypothetical protein
VNLGKAITLDANISIANGVSIHQNGLVLNLNGKSITTTAGTVTEVIREVVTVVTVATGTTQSSQTALVAVPELVLLQLHQTTPMRATGGSGDGIHQYLTTTPSLCSVTSAGVVTAIAAGSCLITATKAASGNYFAATSPVIAITISDSVAAAAAQAAADKAIVDAAKAVADKVIADKAIADKAAADAAAAAAVESGGGAPIANADLSRITYYLPTTIKTIKVDLADKYAYAIAYVDVKKLVLINGKYVSTYVRVGTVLLDEFGVAIVKTTIGIKAGNVIRVSIIGVATDVPVAYVTVK